MSTKSSTRIFCNTFEALIEDGVVATRPPLSAPKPDTTALTETKGRHGRGPDIRESPRPDDDVTELVGVASDPEVTIGDVHSNPGGLIRSIVSGLGRIAGGLIKALIGGQPPSETARRVDAGSDTDDGEHKDDHEILVSRADDSKDPTLVIIPCSGRKTSGSHVSYTSETLLDALPAELANRLVAARRAVAPAAGLDETTLSAGLETLRGHALPKRIRRECRSSSAATFRTPAHS